MSLFGLGDSQNIFPTQMTGFFLGAFFENVFYPKGAPKNSSKWGVWGVWGVGVRVQGLGFRVKGKSHNRFPINSYIPKGTTLKFTSVLH